MTEQQPDAGPGPGADVEVPTDPLVGLRRELDGLESVEVEDRVAVFERVNEVLAGELAALDEV